MRPEENATLVYGLRLRENSAHPLHTHAADAIERLEREVERLRGELVKAHVIDDVDEDAWWCRCGSTNYDMPRRMASHPHADHRAHVAAILDGTA